MIKYSLVAFALFSCLIVSCIPDGVEQQMNDGLKQSMEMFSDQDFKKAVGFIELHKLRNGHYPETLSELEFIGPMDSSVFSTVHYSKLPEGYELNLEMTYKGIDGKDLGNVDLALPEKFWQGLGCVKSNLMRQPKHRTQ